jgi:hypothetical protein
MKQRWSFCEAQETKTSAPFNYAGPLTEAVLLGVVAARFPDRQLDLDVTDLQFTNVDEANVHLKRTYRRGFEVEGSG